MKPLSLIVAMSENRVIGREGDLPWHLPDDMKWFVNKTKGHQVIMGRANFDSIGNKPLPNRHNIILTRDKNYSLTEEAMATGEITVVQSMQDAINIAQSQDDEPFIIGGEQIYKAALPFVTRMYITLVHTHVEGDRFFPNFNPSDFEVTEKTEHPADDRHIYPFTFITYERSS
ncbi:Dihydrofolate reductase [Poriferisphaera corsica]|uniref:Dihydrofolate reductase n=1 Tax=Poriferisphaera corsica TaxID=2528020 RepID=A0A517YRD3_9BACT|nr:dihydrofolate reductase [Poriferisphaera corsica]QDU32788.1 Dihydrofolate reductase [Poriferisphaera corsica]